MSDAKIVIITGASQGIGHAVASRFLREGWQVLSCSRQEMPEQCGREPLWVKHIPTDSWSMPINGWPDGRFRP
jgi:NAD(P)-dependent dehydrogenase (short-subunit alcohol dehydrogenase family)